MADGTKAGGDAPRTLFSLGRSGKRKGRVDRGVAARGLPPAPRRRELVDTDVATIDPDEVTDADLSDATEHPVDEIDAETTEGGDVAEPCPSCSLPLVPGAMFCGECGTRVDLAPKRLRRRASCSTTTFPVSPCRPRPTASFEVAEPVTGTLRDDETSTPTTWPTTTARDRGAAPCSVPSSAPRASPRPMADDGTTTPRPSCRGRGRADEVEVVEDDAEPSRPRLSVEDEAEPSRPSWSRTTPSPRPSWSRTTGRAEAEPVEDDAEPSRPSWSSDDRRGRAGRRRGRRRRADRRGRRRRGRADDEPAPSSAESPAAAAVAAPAPRRAGAAEAESLGSDGAGGCRARRWLQEGRVDRRGGGRRRGRADHRRGRHGRRRQERRQEGRPGRRRPEKSTTTTDGVLDHGVDRHHRGADDHRRPGADRHDHARRRRSTTRVRPRRPRCPARPVAPPPPPPASPANVQVTAPATSSAGNVLPDRPAERRRHADVVPRHLERPEDRGHRVARPRARVGANSADSRST